MKLVIVSDTHCHEIDPPAGDLLLHCGDLTYNGTESELVRVNENFGRIRDRYTHGIVFIAGNHDFLFQDSPALARSILSHGSYLEDSGVTIDGLKFWGSPWTLRFFEWAFMDEDSALEEYWSRIPETTDVLVTHGPPYGVLDLTTRHEWAGSTTLARALDRVRPALHAFGHIHEAYGELRRNGTHFINASSCDFDYENTQPPVVVHI
jgi:Icc-related predicted phosphoesterase